MMLRKPKRRIPPPQQVIDDDFQPSMEWVQEPSNYILLLHLPGFKKEDLSIISDKSGKITVRGRKQVSDFRFTGFERSYDLPKDSNLEKISWQIKDGVLALTIPKVVAVVSAELDKTFQEKKKEPVLMVVGEKKIEVPKETKGEGKQEGGAAINELKRGQTMSELPKEIKGEGKPEGAAAINELKRGQTMRELPKETKGEGKPEGASAINELKQGQTISKLPEQIKGEGISNLRNEAKATVGLKELNEKPTIKETKTEKLKETNVETALKDMTTARLKELNEKTTMKEQKMATLEQGKADTAMKEMVEEPKQEKKIENNTKEGKEEVTVKKETNQKEVSASIDQRMMEELMERKPRSMEGKKEEITKEYKLEGFKEKHEAYEKEQSETTKGLEEKTKEREGGKKRRLWNEEDNGWLDWFDREFIDGVLRKVKRNRKLITIALVAFSTGLYVSQKFRKRG